MANGPSSANTGAELAILVPVLGRPHRVRPLLESIAGATPEARVVFIANPDDGPELDELEAVGAEVLLSKEYYAGKINLGVRETTESLLFFGADDLHFHTGWLEKARERMRPGIGVVATNDLCQKRVAAGELATHPLVTRAYAERETIDATPGPLCERYLHEYVDREFSEVARARGAFAYAPEAIVEHLHPLVGKAPQDDLYRDSQRRMRLGRRVYAERRHLWMLELKKRRV